MVQKKGMDSTGRVGINTTTYSDARDSLIVAPIGTNLMVTD